MFYRIDLQIGGEFFNGREGFKSREAAERWVKKQNAKRPGCTYRITEVSAEDETAQMSRRRGPKLVEWR